MSMSMAVKASVSVCCVTQYVSRTQLACHSRGLSAADNVGNHWFP